MPGLLKKHLLRSLAIAAGVATASYLLMWGLVTTHQEIGISAQAAFPVAAWAFALAFIGSFIFYAAKSAGARRH